MLLVAMEKFSPHRCHHHGNGTGEAVTWGHVSRELVAFFRFKDGFGEPVQGQSTLLLEDCVNVLPNQFHGFFHDYCIIFFFSFVILVLPLLHTTCFARKPVSFCVSADSCLWKVCGCVKSFLLSPSSFQFVKIGVSFVCCVNHPPTSLLKGQSIGSNSVAFFTLGRLMIRWK